MDVDFVLLKRLVANGFGQYEVNSPLSASVGVKETYAFDSYMVRLDEQEPSISDLRNLRVDQMLSLVVGMPVRFLTVGMDVLHSFAVPSLGVKIDAVPGRINGSDVLLMKHGVFYGQCSELCGQGHGFMPIGVYVQYYPQVELPDNDPEPMTLSEIEETALQIRNERIEALINKAIRESIEELQKQFEATMLLAKQEKQLQETEEFIQCIIAEQTERAFQRRFGKQLPPEIQKHIPAHCKKVKK